MSGRVSQAGARAKDNPCLRKGFHMSSAPENPKQTPSPAREPHWGMPVPPETVRYLPPLWQWLCIVGIGGWVVAVWFLCGFLWR